MSTYAFRPDEYNRMWFIIARHSGIMKPLDNHRPRVRMEHHSDRFWEYLHYYGCHSPVTARMRQANIRYNRKSTSRGSIRYANSREKR